jgi:hypothetical protein
MGDGLSGDEALGMSKDVQSVMEELALGHGPGLFTEDERRYLAGVKDFSELKSPDNSRRQKRHQVREKIANGLYDLMLASLLLPTDEWRQVFTHGYSSAVTMPEAERDDFPALLQALKSLISTVAYTADGLDEQGAEAENVVANSLELYHQLVQARDTGTIRDFRGGGIEFSTEGQPLPLWAAQDAQTTDQQRYYQFRVANGSREEVIRSLV